MAAAPTCLSKKSTVTNRFCSGTSLQIVAAVNGGAQSVADGLSISLSAISAIGLSADRVNADGVEDEVSGL